jgi:hypothetical protein
MFFPPKKLGLRLNIPKKLGVPSVSGQVAEWENDGENHVTSRFWATHG